MARNASIEIPKGHLPYQQWEELIRDSGARRSCSSLYTVEFLRKVEILNAGWPDGEENFRIRNYVARRMRRDGWQVEVSRAWDPGQGNFVCLEAVRQRDYCREHDPDYQLPELLLGDNE